MGIAVHEMVHALGFLHEQSRPDRDDYVSIITGNIIPGRESNFAKFASQHTKLHGIGYDYGSLMHYSSMVQM